MTRGLLVSLTTAILVLAAGLGCGRKIDLTVVADRWDAGEIKSCEQVQHNSRPLLLCDHAPAAFALAGVNAEVQDATRRASSPPYYSLPKPRPKEELQQEGKDEFLNEHGRTYEVRFDTDQKATNGLHGPTTYWDCRKDGDSIRCRTPHRAPEQAK